MGDELTMAPSAPVDLDTCAREPIHVPGSIQPRGVLLVVHDDVVVQASATTATHLGRDVSDVLGRTLAEVVGAQAAAVVVAHASAPGEVRDRNPALVHLPDGRACDVIVHRPPDTQGVLGIELEPADGPRPLTYATTFQQVRGSLGNLIRSRSLDELYDVAAREVRTLTGFDRVMVYRFDAEYNGEVVAEAKREDLNSFHGLHYPATDIPAQARALYEKNWIRLISDVGYTPSPLVPPRNPVTGVELDLTYSSLRSVSPIHVEYLQNMGVTASMSISLLKDGALWGLIACHHYSGPHAPSYGARAAAEFLGSTLSLRLVAQVEQDRLTAARRVAHDLAGLVAATRDEDLPLTEALAQHPALLPIMGADGAVVRAQGRTVCIGDTPSDPHELLRWATATGAEVTATERVTGPPELTDEVAGALAVDLANGDAIVWVRREVTRSLDWGGDPANKAIALQEGDSVRISPRKSFERWRETVRGSSLPWSEDHVDTATVLRRHAVEALYLRGLADTRAAEVLQRSSLPTTMPEVVGWSIDVRYSPADGGRVGGDWYDALCLPDGRLAVAVGDVAGHGMPAASIMGQLRNALRALLIHASSPVAAAKGLDALAKQTMAGEMATLIIVVIDTVTGRVEYVRAGHLPPLILNADGSAAWHADIGNMPIGYSRGEPATDLLHIPPGGGIVLFTDGLVEERGTSLREGLERLRSAFSGPLSGDLDALITTVRDPNSDDDATAVVLRRA